MKVRAKSSNTPYPIWVKGEYITNPPKRPCDGAMRPEGHYIDKGGYPGANVYSIDIDTLCRPTKTIDRLNAVVYENDILLYETEEEIGYFIVEDTDTVVDIINGEILEIQQLKTEDIKIIGNLIDNQEFIEGMQYHAENGLEIPYLPLLDVQVTALPYFKFECQKCHKKMLSCKYIARHKECGGFLTAGFATKIYRDKEKVLA